MRYVPEGEVEPPALRRLRLLVMGLTIVLIVGFVAMVATIVIRLGFGGGAEPVSADSISLPIDAEVVATGQGRGTLHFLLRSPDGTEALHIFDANSGDEISRTVLVRE